MKNNEFLSRLYSRNLGLITAEQQNLISTKTLLIAGCGVGSQIALSAARMGFDKFIIVDGDRVELSNNNRQSYNCKDIGKRKVDALSRKIKAINPHAKIQKYPVFIDLKNAESLVEKADIIIDAIDPTSPLPILAIHRYSRKQEKHVIIPLDTGWGASVIIFSPESPSYEKTIGLDEKAALEDISYEDAFEKIAAHLIKILPEYAKEIAYCAIKDPTFNYPQPVTAVNAISSLTITAAIRIALKFPVIVAPKFISFDPDIALTP